MIRFLPRYVSREVLDVIYKSHIRPQLNYGHMIYHKYDAEMHLIFTQKPGQMQHLAALAVTGTTSSNWNMERYKQAETV